MAFSDGCPDNCNNPLKLVYGYDSDGYACMYVDGYSCMYMDAYARTCTDENTSMYVNGWVDGYALTYIEACACMYDGWVRKHVYLGSHVLCMNNRSRWCKAIDQGGVRPSIKVV
jgi:hypothetical protein